MNSVSTTAQQVEQYVVVASDASNPQHQQQANALLHEWVTSNSDTVIADTILELLRSSKREVVLFYALTIYLRLDNATPQQRAIFRRELLTQLVPTVVETSNQYQNSSWEPTYLRTKVGVLLAHFIQLDYPHAWPSVFDELTDPQLLQVVPDIFLRTLVALMDDFGKNETKSNARIKDILRGYTDQPDPMAAAIAAPQQTVSAQLIRVVARLLQQALNGNEVSVGDRDGQIQVAILCLTVMKGFMSWVDLSLLLDQNILQLLFEALAKGSKADSVLADGGVVAIECMRELTSRGMEDEKKISLLQHVAVLEKIHKHVDLNIVDASPIDVVMEVAKFVNKTGLEVLPILVLSQQPKPEDVALRAQLFELFLQCFAFDDIDVSGAVMPLAGMLVSDSILHQAENLLPRVISVTYTQMKYPDDFQYDFEDDDEAEEEMYRTELRKLNQKLVCAKPEMCLQFLVQTLAQLRLPLSTAPTPDIEAAISLIYQYCEGIRPPPGMKVVMKNEVFRNLLAALHSSDVSQHQHREVLILYYETSVRYYPILKERPDLLQIVLQAMTGTRGLQHESQKVRSRTCYLLLRLIKSVGSTSSNAANNVLRPYVETAISGIQTFLEHHHSQLRSEDVLNLFETIGLLLGKTGLSPQEQQQYLTQVMTPHVRSIESVLADSQQAIKEDPDTYGEKLSNSIAAIAYLSKGFKRPPIEVQAILLETSQIAMAVLEALPTNDVVRSKTLVLIQRLIQCLEEKILPVIPRMLFVLISNCTSEDILDVAQLMNQLCMKFRANAITSLDASLLPFLQRCQYLSTQLLVESSHANAEDVNAPHLRTEQLSIQKLSYVVLQHVVVHRSTAMLLSPTNVSSLEAILQIMSNGAIQVEDPVMKKSCLVFFRELLDQWIPCADGRYEEAPTVQPSEVLVQGMVKFFCDTLLPGMLQVFLSTSSHFNVDDANHFRCLSEFSGMMEILMKRLPEVYKQEILLNKFAVRAGFSQAVIEEFRTATNRKDVELAFKRLILELRKTQK